ncbi:NAD(P)H-dependent oxidoreductase [Pedobacter sp. PAMC26386]|nr:NAD(P)H-dependent oxidoreductase [Pedobacter sp. PAMC26386]
MAEKIKIVAISGSTRQRSSNLNLIKAVQHMAANLFELSVFEGLTDLPHFNPDLDNEDVSGNIKSFRNILRAADGILICTPEYAVGVPGTLKNAIDWTVGTMEFSQKPVALITAATSGARAHESLLGTLLIIEAKITADMQLLIPAVRIKVTDAGEITDSETFTQVNKLISSLVEVIQGDKAVDYLPAPLLMDPS